MLKLNPDELRQISEKSAASSIAKFSTITKSATR